MSRELEMAKLACRALDEKKGKDIKVIDIHEVSVIADYFVIASASNQNQVQAMVDNVDETLGRAGFEAKQIEGTRNSSWVLMDYGDMIVHVKNLERWKGTRYQPISGEIKSRRYTHRTLWPYISFFS